SEVVITRVYARVTSRIGLTRPGAGNVRIDASFTSRKGGVSYGDATSASSAPAARGLRAPSVAAPPGGAPRHRRARDGAHRRQLRTREAPHRTRVLILGGEHRAHEAPRVRLAAMEWTTPT